MSLSLFLYLVGAALGAVLGSFLGVVIIRSGEWRVESGEWKAKESNSSRSLCLSCGRQLAWWENVPVLSFLVLRGRCRTCRSPIPYWLLLIELAGSAGGIWAAGEIGGIGEIGGEAVIRGIGAAVIAAALVWVFFSDLVYGVVPDAAVGLGSLGAIAVRWPEIGQIGLIGLIWPAVAGAGFLALLVLLTRGRGMGTGDVTLQFFLGLWLEWPLMAVGIWLGFVCGGLVGVGLIIVGKKRFGQPVPFGPFLIAGAIVARWRGMELLRWLGW